MLTTIYISTYYSFHNFNFSPSSGILSNIIKNFSIKLCKNFLFQSSFSPFPAASFFCKIFQYFRHLGTFLNSRSLRAWKENYEIMRLNNVCPDYYSKFINFAPIAMMSTWTRILIFSLDL